MAPDNPKKNDVYNKEVYELKHAKLLDMIRDFDNRHRDAIKDNTDRLNEEIKRSSDRSDEGAQALRDEMLENRKTLREQRKVQGELLDFKTEAGTDIKNMCRDIAQISKSITWGITTVVAMLAGFFIWYIQNIGR